MDRKLQASTKNYSRETAIAESIVWHPALSLSTVTASSSQRCDRRLLRQIPTLLSLSLDQIW